jgi:hypothetical protein
VLLQHFWLGLSEESALQLDIAAGGSFMHKTTAEGEALLEHILENTSYTESLPVVESSSHEEAPLFESAPLLLTYPDLTTEPSPEPETMEEEEIQPSGFPFEFEEDLFEDFGNTSNHFHQKKPQVPIGPTEPLDKAFLKETVKDLTAIMSSEWVKERKPSSEALQILAPSLTIQCNIHATLGKVLYNPMVGANIKSASYAFTHLGKHPLILLSVKTRRRAATGNTKSREASRTAGGPRSLGQRPEIRHTSWLLGC